ncbi:MULTISPECIES: hypothetical protein [Pseudomonas]|uniref:Uncharacterized protein n=1 Tax=Pseudomonas azadiae TaxID=2843612 RepID=A0ABS6NU93_9PSED|nr:MULTISPECIES: hypothetical protein [Pseudomonas]MBV4451376.1 hypothetical protein [Pseudomonas azadiae]NMF42385.1 hypothetical protein [Pseudomonas sp. SWRI 103]
MTPLSKSLEELITDIYKDDEVSVTEYSALRDDADRRMAAVIKEFGLHNNVTAFQKSIDVAMQLLQTSVIDSKKAKLTDTGEAIVRDAVTAQVEYLRAGSQLALRLL